MRLSVGSVGVTMVFSLFMTNFMIFEAKGTYSSFRNIHAPFAQQVIPSSFVALSTARRGRTMSKETEAMAKRGSLKKIFDSGVDVEDFAPDSTVKVSRSHRKPAAVSGVGGRRQNKKGKRAGTVEEEDVSPALAQWAASKTNEPSSSSTLPSTSTETESLYTKVIPSEATKAKARRGHGGKNIARRMKQAERKSIELGIMKKTRECVSDLEDLLEVEKNRDLESILRVIRTLVEECSPSPGSSFGSVRSMFASPKSIDYRMAWAGSNAAICALGTGLHNVPLARLQEIFMTIGKNRVEVQEVIRILGPFPNVKNVLQGNAKIPKGASQQRRSNQGGTQLRISYDSMIDGTGKEIIAGKDENERGVDIEVLHASEDALVCWALQPDNDDEKNDPFGQDGEYLMLFVKEDDLAAQLEILRVA